MQHPFSDVKQSGDYLEPPVPEMHHLLQDKILQSVSRDQKVTVTNDGATILKSLYVDNPAAKVLVGEAFH